MHISLHFILHIYIYICVCVCHPQIIPFICVQSNHVSSPVIPRIIPWIVWKSDRVSLASYYIYIYIYCSHQSISAWNCSQVLRKRRVVALSLQKVPLAGVYSELVPSPQHFFHIFYARCPSSEKWLLCPDPLPGTGWRLDDGSHITLWMGGCWGWFPLLGMEVVWRLDGTCHQIP